ncbi:MAG TPA: alpha/beta fold hydrolase [Anaerolineales bacterium]|nr:alpha/beta fold hydrolase [Anaerolineales bacterium]
MTHETIWKARELEILHLLAEGLTNNEIAARLHLSQETVRWYNKRIFEKLGAGNRTQAVQRASELNLLKGQERGVSSKKVHRSPVRYVPNNGVHIAYQIIGDGPVDLLFIHGFISNLEIAWEDPEYNGFFEQLGQFARVILFDKRGLGLSDRIRGAPSLENTLDDAICVLNAAGSNRTFVMGTSEGGAAAVLLASTHPERVEGLILYSSTPKLVQTNGEPDWAEDEETFNDSIERIQKQWGGPWAIQNFAPSRAQNETFRDWWAKVLRSSTSPSGAGAVLRILRDIDIRPLLPQVRIQTLVIHKTHDRILTVEAGRYFATHMPNAKWVELPGADHFFFVDSAQVVSAISQFCREKPPEPNADTMIGIILYLHLPNFKKKEKAIQLEFKEHRAKGIFFSDNEATAVFDSPSRAIQCALKLRELITDDALRISLHVGECTAEDGKPSHTVIEVARHAANFLPLGKILFTQTLRDILAGSGVVFDLRQIHIDKQNTESVSFYALTQAKNIYT